MSRRGFTLVEMLVVITISAILVAAAVPALQWTIARNKVSDAVNMLLSHIEYSRLASSREGNAVVVCRTLDPNAAVGSIACSDAANATTDGNDWASGWIVFGKADGNNVVGTFEVGDRLIFRQQAFVGGTRVMIHTNLGVAGIEGVAFRPRGFGGFADAGTLAVHYGEAPTSAVASRALGTLTLNGTSRCLVLNFVGGASVIQPGAGCP